MFKEQTDSFTGTGNGTTFSATKGLITVTGGGDGTLKFKVDAADGTAFEGSDELAEGSAYTFDFNGIPATCRVECTAHTSGTLTANIKYVA